MLTFSAFRRITDPDFLKSPSVWICSSKDVQASTRKLKERSLFRWPDTHLSKSYYSAKVHQQTMHYTPFREFPAIPVMKDCWLPKFFSKIHLFTHNNFNEPTQSYSISLFSLRVQDLSFLLPLLLHIPVSTLPSPI